MRVVRAAPALSSSDEEVPASRRAAACTATTALRRPAGHGRLQGHRRGRRQRSPRLLGPGRADRASSCSRRLALPCGRTNAIATVLPGAGATSPPTIPAACFTPAGVWCRRWSGGGGTGGQRRRVEGSLAEALPLGNEGEGFEDAAVGRSGEDVLEIARQRAREPEDLACPQSQTKREDLARYVLVFLLVLRKARGIEIAPCAFFPGEMSPVFQKSSSITPLSVLFGCRYPAQCAHLVVTIRRKKTSYFSACIYLERAIMMACWCPTSLVIAATAAASARRTSPCSSGFCVGRRSGESKRASGERGWTFMITRSVFCGSDVADWIAGWCRVATINVPLPCTAWDLDRLKAFQWREQASGLERERES